MRWFRFYSDAVDNYKLRLISYEDRWHYTAILCCKSQGLLDGKRSDFVKRAVSMKLGLRVSELDEVARRLSEVGLIEEKNLQPIGWDERQFISDDSTLRVRKSRINKKTRNVTSSLLKRHCNAPDTDTDTDTEKPFVSHEKIVFDGTSFKGINGQLDVWKSAYPAVDITAELNKIAAWVVANPKNVKKQWGRFINSWLSRAQDKAPRVVHSRSEEII